MRGENGEPTCATLNERAKASLPSPFSRHLESTPGGSGRLPVGARRGKSCRPSHATHHRVHVHSIHPDAYRPSACAARAHMRTRERERERERRGPGLPFVRFSSFHSAHQKKPSFAPGLCPHRAPKACRKCNTGDFNGSITAHLHRVVGRRDLWLGQALGAELAAIIPAMIGSAGLPLTTREGPDARAACL